MYEGGAGVDLYEGGVDFFKIDGNGGVWKFLLEKGGLGKMGGGVCLEMGGLPYYIEVFLEIPHDAA